MDNNVCNQLYLCWHWKNVPENSCLHTANIGYGFNNNNNNNTTTTTTTMTTMMIRSTALGGPWPPLFF